MSNPKDLQEFLKKNSKPKPPLSALKSKLDNSGPTPPQTSRKPVKVPGDHINSDYFATIFESADRDKSGTLTREEFQNCFQSLGLNWGEDFEAEFNSWDINGDGQVSYEG